MERRSKISLSRKNWCSKGREEGIELGRKEGIELGREEGIELGREEERLSIISTLLNNGMSQEEIIKMTGISL